MTKSDKKLKGILIDPKAKTVTDVEVNGTGINAIYAAIEASPFSTINLDGRDVVYVDDEFLVRRDPPFEDDFFKIGTLPDPIGGKALILGVDDEGETVDTTLSAEKVMASVRFSRQRFLGIETKNSNTARGFLIQQKANFETISEDPEPSEKINAVNPDVRVEVIEDRKVFKAEIDPRTKLDERDER